MTSFGSLENVYAWMQMEPAEKRVDQLQSNMYIKIIVSWSQH